MIAIARTPGTFENPPDTSTCSSEVLRLRSFQGVVTMPANPPPGVVIWKMFLASGNE